MSLRQTFKDHTISFAAGAAPLAVFMGVEGMGLTVIPPATEMGVLLTAASCVSYGMANHEISGAFKKAVDDGHVRKKAGAVLAGTLAVCLAGMPFLFKADHKREEATQRRAQAAEVLTPSR